MARALPSLIIPCALSVAAVLVPYAIAAQEVGSSFCGRVVDVSCTGPSSAATLVLAQPESNSNRRVVIPAEHRHLFGTGLEAQYDQQMVCLTSVPAFAGAVGDPAIVRDPSELVVKGIAQPSIALPDNVARTCDPDLQPPVLTRDVKPNYTSDAMRAKVHGSVFLRGVVDRGGTVRDIRVMQSLEPSLDASAREAFAQWQFRPAIRGGEPVAIVISVQMQFTLR